MFFTDKHTEQNINPYSAFIEKKIKKWKDLKNIETPLIPLLLCRMCEEMIPANKMLVTNHFNLIKY